MPPGVVWLAVTSCFENLSVMTGGRVHLDVWQIDEQLVGWWTDLASTHLGGHAHLWCHKTDFQTACNGFKLCFFLLNKAESYFVRIKCLDIYLPDGIYLICQFGFNPSIQNLKQNSSNRSASFETWIKSEKLPMWQKKPHPLILQLVFMNVIFILKKKVNMTHCHC